MRWHPLVSILSLLVASTACGPKAVSDDDANAGTENGDTDESSTGSATDEGSTDDPDPTDDPDCQLALRLDQCCNGPIPADADDIALDDCLAPFPVDYAALPPDLLAMCVGAQPDVCQVIDCATATPASETLERDDNGQCQFVCPPEESIGYPDPGCNGPGPVPLCLPPPPPCADEFCSCAGETIFGCGYVGEPYEHLGPCE